MKRYIVTSLAACLVGYAAGASAMDLTAVVRQPQGKVFVSQGSAMALAQEGMPLYAGNRVITVSGGRAEVAYVDGCVVTLPENSLLAVKGSDQCRRGQAQIRATGGFQSARIGQAPPTSSSETEKPIADFKHPQGSVLVNEIPAQHNMDARRNDQIVTGEDSKVTVVFRGCEVEVGPGAQVTVGELRERCKEGVFLASGEDPDTEIAIIKQVQGGVMISQGAARNDMGVKSSNQIVTSSGSKVTVIFKACEVVVGENVSEKDELKVKDLVTKCKGGLWADAGAGGLGGGAGAGIGLGAGVGLIGGSLGVSVIGAIIVGNGKEAGAASPQ